MKAVCYARVSSAEQARPDATSIEQQLERCSAYAHAQGWEVVARLADEGISGATTLEDRPHGSRLLSEPPEVVIFWAMDRFTRSAVKGLNDIERLEGLGVSLVFVKEAIDTRTSVGRLFRGMLALFAEFERETIRDRSMSGRYGTASKGRWPWGAPPFGYTTTNERFIEAHPEEAAVVQRIFATRVAKRTSAKSIAADLNRSGTYPRPRGGQQGRWAASSIRGILANPAYKGDGITRTIARSHGERRETFTIEAPALVSPADWQRAQTAHHAPVVPGAGTRTTLYALSERLWHAHEDGLFPFHGQNRYDRPGGSGRVYRCAGSIRQEYADPNCPGLGISPRNGHRMTALNADRTEGYVLLWLLRALDIEEAVAFVEEAEERLSILDPAAEDAEAMLSEVVARMGRWREMYGDGLINRTELDARLSDLAIEEQRLKGIIGRTLDLASKQRTIAEVLDHLFNLSVQPGGEDEVAAEVVLGTDEWRHLLEVHARAAVNREAPLPEWVRQETTLLLDAIEGVVVVHGQPEGDPRLEVSFQPSALLSGQVGTPIQGLRLRLDHLLRLTKQVTILGA